MAPRPSGDFTQNSQPVYHLDPGETQRSQGGGKGAIAHRAEMGALAREDLPALAGELLDILEQRHRLR